MSNVNGKRKARDTIPIAKVREDGPLPVGGVVGVVGVVGVGAN